MSQSIVMLCSLDTKAREVQYLKDCLGKQGAKTVLVDVGYGQPAKMAANVTARELASAVAIAVHAARSTFFVPLS